MKYPKIDTLFKRDDKGIIIPTEYTREEFDYLKHNRWECTEKIDGTNIRIEIKGKNISFAGRTENAIIPQHLLDYLCSHFTKEVVFTALNLDEDEIDEDFTCTIFGEGYGEKIQTYGKRYKCNTKGVGFALFDVKIGNWWLLRSDLEAIAMALKCDIVPFMGYMSLPDAIEFVKNGFRSKLAEDITLPAEGLVLKTACGLLDRGGNRLITKLKTCDFTKYDNAHKDDK